MTRQVAQPVRVPGSERHHRGKGSAVVYGISADPPSAAQRSVTFYTRRGEIS